MDIDRVAQTLVGRSILITGGSGFMGKVLIEKILRVCPEIYKIYLLLRTKKGKEPNQRLSDIFCNPLFDIIKEKYGFNELLKKCKVISGDVALPDLGISKMDRENITDNVSIIYHCAATIRFDEGLTKAVMINVRGTKLIIQLAKECTKLDMFCHMSTSYCHLNEKLLLEKPYPPPGDPHKIIQIIELLDEDAINALTEKLLGNLPNTYAFTKALSESLVVEAMESVPSLLLRPSIVIPIHKEPIPGWTDNLNGPAGLLIAAGKGVVRTMYGDNDGYGDYMPVDTAINYMLIATWNYVQNKDVTKRIYHLTSSSEVKVPWNALVEVGKELVVTKIPFNNILWYPGGGITKSRLYHNICIVLFHFLPAIFIDTLCICFGYKPFLIRVHKRICKGFEVFDYYTSHQWDFDNKNLQHLRTLLNRKEESLYYIKSDIDLRDYVEKTIRGCRKYILNESDDKLPAARRTMKIMWWVDKLCKFVIIGFIIYFITGYMLSFWVK